MLANLIKPINRHQWIAEAAYFTAEIRDFEPGKELDDWLEAETAYSEMLITAYLVMQEEDHSPITVVGLKELAYLLGIESTEHLNKKIELIQAIQNATQHHPCFRSEPSIPCEEEVCQWKTECKKLIAIWYR